MILTFEPLPHAYPFRFADRTLEKAEARGHVIVEDRTIHRRGEGGRAIWVPQPDVVTLIGSPGKPAVALDEKGNRVTGGTLRFQKGRAQVDVETGEGNPTEVNVKPEKS